MLWKFFLQHQKHHVMENHAMEIHVRQGTTVLHWQEASWDLDQSMMLLRFWKNFSKVSLGNLY